MPRQPKKMATETPVEENMEAKASFHIIVLGPTGGPCEDRVTGILVRSTATDWSPGSVVAVDAGTMLAGIIRLSKKSLPASLDDRTTSPGVLNNGPFKGLRTPDKTPEANAAHFFREIIGALLITHPHLDHISGLAINTPIIEAGHGPKPIAALPSVLSAIKNHVFNDVIWPNLSDEDGGAGLLTYNRLTEGGNPRLGIGDGRGYVRACQGIVTKCLSVSHGQCKQRYHPETATHRRAASTVFHQAEARSALSRARSVDRSEAAFYSPANSPHLHPGEPVSATVESSAFFLRDHDSGNEIIIFGDVEPDSVAFEPRNRRVWETAAPKIAAGKLRAIFIECSYDDSVDDDFLYGHMCPRHLTAELSVLADKVMDHREAAPSDIASSTERKRKRLSGGSRGGTDSPAMSPRTYKRNQSVSGIRSLASRDPRSHPASIDYGFDGADEYSTLGIFADYEAPDPNRWADVDPLPLAGLAVYIIHIKETLTDGPPPGVKIIEELREHGREANLGCRFLLPDPEAAIWV
ncbi:Cyclic-AMP phosphodiesterase class-II [Penicillium chermesinum]|nr:Cyclic-AMP phosphodiesterase class-II [Penicillium chermesinum]